VSEVRLYIGNLPYSTAEAELEELFMQAGEVTSAVIVTDRDTGRSRGFGFVEFATEAEAQEAIQKFNGVEFGGRTLRVDVARERQTPPSQTY
jgi:RNA recognition motif-containing protein